MSALPVVTALALIFAATASADEWHKHWGVSGSPGLRVSEAGQRECRKDTRDQESTGHHLLFLSFVAPAESQACRHNEWPRFRFHSAAGREVAPECAAPLAVHAHDRALTHPTPPRPLGSGRTAPDTGGSDSHG